MKSKHLTNAHYYYAVDIFFSFYLKWSSLYSKPMRTTSSPLRRYHAGWFSPLITMLASAMTLSTESAFPWPAFHSGMVSVHSEGLLTCLVALNLSVQLPPPTPQYLVCSLAWFTSLSNSSHWIHWLFDKWVKGWTRRVWKETVLMRITKRPRST